MCFLKNYLAFHSATIYFSEVESMILQTWIQYSYCYNRHIPATLWKFNRFYCRICTCGTCTTSERCFYLRNAKVINRLHMVGHKQLNFLKRKQIIQIQHRRIGHNYVYEKLIISNIYVKKFHRNDWLLVLYLNLRNDFYLRAKIMKFYITKIPLMSVYAPLISRKK